MKSYLLYSLLAIAPLFSFSQYGSVKGKVIDSALKQNLSSATVIVTKKTDSSFAGYSISDKKGSFEITGLSYGEYILLVSFNGYEHFQKKVSVTKENKTADAGNIFLQKNYSVLDGITVTDAVPVRINGDTVSYKPGAFYNRPDATVEDVLKKIPGMQVQRDGSINAMGESVQKVYVNGKEFFGNDPKLATRNITADMVDQIQVYDDMSEQAKFTKIDDGSKSKTINIKLKKDRNRGDFGRFTAGVGNDNRYDGNLSYNRFRGDQRVSIIGTANNTNKQGYSFNDNGSQGMTQFSQGSSGGGFSSGGMNASAGGGIITGISIPRSAGINYNDTWGAKMDFSSSYHFSENEFNLSQQRYKKYFFPGDSSSAENSNSNSRTINKNHRINARWEFKLDSMNSLLYTGNISVQESGGEYADSFSTVSEAVNNYLALSGQAIRNNSRNGINYSGEFLYRRKFNKQGRTFTFGWRNGYLKNESDNFNQNPILTYDLNGDVLNFINLDQQSEQFGDNRNNILSASYTEPMGKGKLLEFNYAYADSKSVSDKKTFDYDSVSAKYVLPDLYQTNYFEYRNSSSRLGTNFRMFKNKFNYQLGMAVQQTELESRSITALTGKDTTLSQRFINLFPTANFNFTLDRSKSIRISYRGRTNTPSVTQVQDVPDYSNPLQVKTGNPSLKQEFASNITFGYNTFNVRTYNFFNANISFNTTANKIVNTMDSAGTVSVIIRPENMSGSYNGSGMFSFGFPFRKMKGGNLNFTTMAFYSKDANSVYKRKVYTNILSLTQSAGYNLNRPNFDFGLTGNFSYNKLSYTFRPDGNTEYFKQSWSADFSYRFPGSFFVLTDVDYLLSTRRSEGFNQEVLLWNMAIAKKFLKNKAAELKLTLYDILNRSRGVNRTVSENYFEDTRSNVVPRFLLVSFTYHLKQKVQRKPAQ
jgi:Outer membrane protein beta-barrel family/CarboxypepD_reg-like domain